MTWQQRWQQTAKQHANRFISEMDKNGWWYRKRPFFQVEQSLLDLYDIEPDGEGIKLRPKT